VVNSRMNGTARRMRDVRNMEASFQKAVNREVLVLSESVLSDRHARAVKICPLPFVIQPKAREPGVSEAATDKSACIIQVLIYTTATFVQDFHPLKIRTVKGS
jgi:hypothetical protein